MQGGPSIFALMVAGGFGFRPTVPLSLSFSICDALHSIAVSLGYVCSAGGPIQSFIPPFCHHCPSMRGFGNEILTFRLIFKISTYLAIDVGNAGWIILFQQADNLLIDSLLDNEDAACGEFLPTLGQT